MEITYGSWETMGACVARIQDGFFHSPTILPADWLQDVGGDIILCEYLERARLYPTGRHWVDNLITTTLLAHHFLYKFDSRNLFDIFVVIKGQSIYKFKVKVICCSKLFKFT